MACWGWFCPSISLKLSSVLFKEIALRKHQSFPLHAMRATVRTAEICPTIYTMKILIHTVLSRVIPNASFPEALPCGFSHVLPDAATRRTSALRIKPSLFHRTTSEHKARCHWPATHDPGQEGPGLSPAAPWRPRVGPGFLSLRLTGSRQARAELQKL